MLGLLGCFQGTLQDKTCFSVTTPGVSSRVFKLPAFHWKSGYSFHFGGQMNSAWSNGNMGNWCSKRKHHFAYSFTSCVKLTTPKIIIQAFRVYLNNNFGKLIIDWIPSTKKEKKIIDSVYYKVFSLKKSNKGTYCFSLPMECCTSVLWQKHYRCSDVVEISAEFSLTAKNAVRLCFNEKLSS